MSLRRWLTSQYDWTGLSGLLYKSLLLTIGSFVLMALAVIVFAFSVNFELETIMHFGHYFEMIAIAGVFAFILLPNIIRMWWFVIKRPAEVIPVKKYFYSFSELIIHMFTQKRTLGCDKSQKRWFVHLVLVFAYLALLFTTVFLDWFSSENLAIIVLGYAESAAIFLVTIIFMSGRIKKKNEVHKFSQPSDWFFVIWLFLLGVSAFLVRIFIDANILESNIWLYLFHLIILVQWALIIVPFGKWTHFLYRSFAMYFEAVKQK